MGLVGVVGFVVGLGIVTVVKEDAAACYAVVCPVVDAAVVVGVWAYYVFACRLWELLDWDGAFR